MSFTTEPVLKAVLEAARSFDSGLAKTVQWFIDSDAWWRPISKTVRAGERLGIEA
jgi:dTDP-D-glucose 4,6-dehydratase